MLKIKWAKRLPLNALRMLYLSQAKGLLDTELLEEAAVTLYLRCKDIVAVGKSQNGEVRCPFCYEKDMTENYICICFEGRKKINDNLRCDKCLNVFSLTEYRQCYKREQLNMGGAGYAFERFIREYEQPALPEKRMLQIDRLIHAFHYSLKSSPDQPTRSVGPNLLSANLTTVMAFLNELSGAAVNNAEMNDNAQKWLEEKEKNQEWLKTFERRDEVYEQ